MDIVYQCMYACGDEAEGKNRKNKKREGNRKHICIIL